MILIDEEVVDNSGIVYLKKEDSMQAVIQRLADWSTEGKLIMSKSYEYFRSKGTNKTWVADVWKPFITPKYSFIPWLSAQSRLLIKDKLQHLEIDRSCVFCGVNEESGKHLFFDYLFSNETWE